MDRYLRNAAAVMFAVALTAMAAYGVVLLASPDASGYTPTRSSALAAADGQIQTCPATGCSASSCHATSSGRGQASAGTAAYQGTRPGHEGFEYDH